MGENQGFAAFGAFGATGVTQIKRGEDGAMAVM